MKVKINKVIPIPAGSIPKPKLQFFPVGKEIYTISPYKLDQKNFIGYPIYLQLICTLPDATVDYQYVKFNVTAELSDSKELIERKSERFDDIKKGQHRRDFVFSFVPLKKGFCTIKLDIIYRPKYFVNTQQQMQERKQSVQTGIKFEEPFDIAEFFVTEDKSSSISFPLIIQHSIQSRLPDEQLKLSINFSSQSLKHQFLNDKSQINLKPGQVYYTVLSLKPQDIRTFIQQKSQAIGQLTIKYGQNGKLIKKVNFRPNDKFLFFKGLTLQKAIPKKEIVEVKVRFQKIYNANFGLGNLKIMVDDSFMQGVKVVKTDKTTINLDLNRSDDVVISVICLKSGFFHIKGLTLNTHDFRIVKYVNQITLFVQNQQQQKNSVFQNTTVIEIPIEEQLT